MSAATPSNHRCPECGHEQYFAVTKATVEVSMLVFCSNCTTVMDRLDPLGEIEAAHRSDKPGTFSEYVEAMDNRG